MIRVGGWNVRGLNCPDHQQAASDLITEFKLAFLGLVETRVRLSRASHIQSSISQHFPSFTDYSGLGDQIWLRWDASELRVEVLESHVQIIHSKVYHFRTHTTCLIYGAYDLTTRRELWRHISQLATSAEELPWLLLDDFNVILDSSEASGNAVFHEQPSTEFQQCLVEAGLFTLPMKGAPFSWHNRRDGHASIWKRLVRILSNKAWLEHWPTQFYLCSTPRTSDHSPLILCADNQPLPVKGMFRFENLLARSPLFLHHVGKI